MPEPFPLPRTSPDAWKNPELSIALKRVERQLEAQRQLGVTVDDNHHYQLEDRYLPSVTQVLEYCEITNYTFAPQDARDRGNRVHVAVSQALMGADREHVLRQMRRGERGYVESLLKFCDRHVREVLACEIPVVGSMPFAALGTELMWAGQLDLLCVMEIDDEEFIGLLDFKTHKSHQKATGLQLAAYSMALQVDGIRRFSVLARQDGTFQPRQVKEYSEAKYDAWFAAALAVMHCRRGRRFYRPLPTKDKTIEIGDLSVTIRFPYTTEDRDLMRRLSLSSYYESGHRAYIVPIDAMGLEELDELEKAGFLVKEPDE